MFLMRRSTRKGNIFFLFFFVFRNTCESREILCKLLTGKYFSFTCVTKQTSQQEFFQLLTCRRSAYVAYERCNEWNWLRAGWAFLQNLQKPPAWHPGNSSAKAGYDKLLTANPATRLPGYLATWNISQHTRQLDTALNSRDVCLKFAQVEVALEKCTPASYLFANSEMSAAGSRSVEKSPAVSWHLPQVVSQLVNKVLIRQLLEIATNWHGNAGMMIIFHSLSLSKLQQLILRLAKNDMTIWYVQSACC